jgi:hypothetical protein
LNEPQNISISFVSASPEYPAMFVDLTIAVTHFLRPLYSIFQAIGFNGVKIRSLTLDHDLFRCSSLSIPTPASNNTKHSTGTDVRPCHSTQKITLGTVNNKQPAARK